MKKICVVLVLAIVVCAGALTPSAQARKKRIAIMDFDYATVHSSSAAIFGQDIDIGKGISDLLVNYLVKSSLLPKAKVNPSETARPC